MSSNLFSNIRISPNYRCYIRNCTWQFDQEFQLYEHMKQNHTVELQKTFEMMITKKHPYVKELIPDFKPQPNLGGQYKSQIDSYELASSHNSQKCRQMLEDMGTKSDYLYKFTTDGPFRFQKVFENVQDEFAKHVKQRYSQSMIELQSLEHQEREAQRQNESNDHQFTQEIPNEIMNRLKYSQQHVALDYVFDVYERLTSMGLDPHNSVLADINSNYSYLGFASALLFKVPCLVLNLDDQNSTVNDKLLLTFKLSYRHDSDIHDRLDQLHICNKKFHEIANLKIGNYHYVTHVLAVTKNMDNSQIDRLLDLYVNDPALKVVITDTCQEQMMMYLAHKLEIVPNSKFSIKLNCPEQEVELMIYKVIDSDKTSKANSNSTQEFDQSTKVQDQMTQLCINDNNIDTNKQKKSDENFLQIQQNHPDVFKLIMKFMQCAQQMKDDYERLLIVLERSCEANEIQNTKLLPLSGRNFQLSNVQMQELLSQIGTNDYNNMTDDLKNELVDWYTHWLYMKMQYSGLLDMVNEKLQKGQKLMTYVMTAENAQFKEAQRELYHQGFEVISPMHGGKYVKTFKCKPLSVQFAKFHGLDMREYTVRLPSITNKGEQQVELDTVQDIHRKNPWCPIIKCLCTLKYKGYKVMITDFFQQTLADLLDEEFVTSQEKQEIAKELVIALKECHKINICHLDLCAQSIYISLKMGIVISDWGNSKSILAEGKYGYQPPEQFQDQKGNLFEQPDLKKVDSYALGVILFKLKRCQMPFSDEEIEQLMMNGQVPPLPKCIQEDQKGRYTLIKRLLEGDPEKRLAISQVNMKDVQQIFME